MCAVITSCSVDGRLFRGRSVKLFLTTREETSKRLRNFFPKKFIITAFHNSIYEVIVTYLPLELLKKHEKWRVDQRSTEGFIFLPAQGYKSLKGLLSTRFEMEVREKACITRTIYLYYRKELKLLEI